MRPGLACAHRLGTAGGVPVNGAPVIGRSFRFLVVGLASFAVDVALFNVIVHGPGSPPLEDSPIIAKVISSLISALVSFYGNRLWTFEHGRHGRASTQTVAFLQVNAVAWAILLAPLGISRYVLDLDSALADNVSANVIGLGLAMVFRFWAYGRWVFPSSAAPGEAHAH